jgi:hypothetical protein
MHDSDASSSAELIMATSRPVEETPPARWHEQYLAARPPTPTSGQPGIEYFGVLSSLYTMSLCW